MLRAPLQRLHWVIASLLQVCPIAVARFTENVFMSVLTASLIAGGFTALWLVANELEDPFGTDHNDLPMLQCRAEPLTRRPGLP